MYRGNTIASPLVRQHRTATLQSAIPAPANAVDVVRDFTTAKRDGESNLKEFVEERVYSKHMSVQDCIKRHSSLTFIIVSANNIIKVLKVEK